MSSQPLAVAMRPTSIDHFIGQDFGPFMKHTAEKGLPHQILIVGPPGSGKTSFARIVVSNLGGAEFIEINGAVDNGVDVSRDTIDLLRHAPLPGHDKRVLFLDEAHNLTKQAQEAWLVDAEEPPAHSYIIWGTSDPNKIRPALRRRFYVVQMLGLDRSGTNRLLINARHFLGVEFPSAPSELMDALDEVGISSPGLILQAAEQWFDGKDPKSAVRGALSTSNLDLFAIGCAATDGNWEKVRTLCKDAAKDDAVPLRTMTAACLKTAMLKTASIERAVKCARAINALAAVSEFDDILGLAATLASLCGVCSIMRG